ncbi:motility associated factor glycosyltransferase family protein [Caldalkalibacillus mannanilyticus]|uniref:motility associated factor glycosyltransferase family protein n=1 Tax=Caldalkalibacillus mannanilyticus TaxID=1418 RepID=UPI0004683DE6|nr:6-hydroxymethylpterin diphosphokinase MptE-like protein [Caldalkalibacillus mannanilyticus]
MIGRQNNHHDGKQLYEKNLRLLSPFIQQQLGKLDLREVWNRIDIQFTKDGDPICRYRKGNHLFHLTSREPLIQAQNWANQLHVENVRTLLVYGCGFGYPLIELFKKIHKDHFVIVFEQDLFLFTAMLHFFDLEPLMKTGKFIFFVGTFEEFSPSFSAFLSTVQFIYLTAPSIVYTPHSRIFRKEYSDIQSQIFDTFMLQIKAFGNDLYDSLLGFHHIVANTNEILENPYLGSLKDKYKNVPAFIIANGPSLDQDVLELKRVKGKGLIFCCDSAAIPLMKREILPDAICISERNLDTYHLNYENQKYPEEISLLALAVVDPRIYKTFSGPRIPIFRSKDSSHFINQIIGDGSGLFAGISVAHFAFEAAVYMGANPIVMVGQDLAYGPNQTTHSKESRYLEGSGKEIVSRLHLEPTLHVQSNEGKSIPTNRTWHQFKLMFEQLIEENPHITVVNTTKRGVKIKGTKLDSISNVIDQYCHSSLPYPLHQLISDKKLEINLLERKQKKESFITELKKYMGMYRALETVAVERKNKCERAFELIEEKGMADSREILLQVFEQNFRELNRFLSPQVHVVYFQQVVLVCCHQVNVLGPLHSLLKVREALMLQFELYDRLALICQSLITNFQIGMDRLCGIQEEQRKNRSRPFS